MSTRPRTSSLLISLFTAFAVLVASGVALAEEPSAGEALDQAEELADEADEEEAGEGPADIVTVTANRRQEDIQDAALSVTALSSTFIEDIGLTDFTEMQKFSPNLLITPGIDSRSTGISIRGIGNSGGANAGIDPTVAVFVDGVYQGRAGMSVQDLLDVQSIEILRGPQGTLYGKNTAAGAIKVTTKDPGYEPELSLEFVGGEYEDLQGRFSGNYPLIDDILATRTSGYVVFRDGYETNRAEEHDGDDVNNAEKWGVRNKTLWDVTDDLSVLVSGDYAVQKQDGMLPEVKDYACYVVGPGNDTEPLGNACDTADDQGIELDKRADHTADFKDRDVYANEKPKNDVTTGGAALEITLDQWDHTFTSLTSYRTYTSDSFWDSDFSQLDVSTWDIEVELDQISSELRAASPAWDYADYVAGLYFYYSDMQTDDTLGATEAYLGFDQETTGDNNHTTKSMAGYADASFKLGELWDRAEEEWGIGDLWGETADITFTTGLRVGWERKLIDGKHRSEGLLGDAQTTVSGPDINIDEHKDDTYVTFREVLKYKPVENVMLYASYATGYKSGGYNQLRGDPDRTTYFKPEKSKSWEAGLKTTWLDRMITWNITGFYTDYEDFQVIVADGVNIFVQNAKGFYSTGFETDISIVPVPGWLTVVGVGYVKTKYDDYEDGPCLPEDRILAGLGGECFQDLTGERRANTPTLNINLFSSYENGLPWFDINWFAQVDYNYMSKRYLDAGLDKELLTDRDHLLGLRAGLRDPEMRWEITAWVKNVTDETFEGAGFYMPLIGGYAVVLGPPRTAGVTLRANF
jgi:iron complex outermembrane receptor protein